MVSTNWKLAFGIIIGLISYLLLYIGKGIQKYAIEGFKEVKNEKKEDKRKKTGKAAKNSGIWIFGTILTAAFLFIQWIPLTYFDTPINLIAPLEGFGLIVLLVFSYFVLKEKVTRIEIFGAVLVIVGIIFINVVASSPTALLREDVNFTSFWIFFGIIFGLETLGILIATLILNNKRWSGMLIALLAGTCMAWQTLSKRISDIKGLGWIFVFVVFALATATLGFTQWAFTKIQANLVVPIFTSTSIILTAILGNFVINEIIKLIQIVGMGIIVIGIVLISAFDKPQDLESAVEYIEKKEL
jgi:uncharacterized membrane protein